MPNSEGLEVSQGKWNIRNIMLLYALCILPRIPLFRFISISFELKQYIVHIYLFATPYLYPLGKQVVEYALWLTTSHLYRLGKRDCREVSLACVVLLYVWVVESRAWVVCADAYG